MSELNILLNTLQWIKKQIEIYACSFQLLHSLCRQHYISNEQHYLLLIAGRQHGGAQVRLASPMIRTKDITMH